ncbi:MAG TPA: hypothetical protein DCG58_15640 [Hyphomonas adhaerens]|mgnify:CR=1 FL=1|uniref:PepSY domain-containing protein n=2 Tax=Hyphomonadaceae TaxID=69657 RepID=A0A3B9H1L9_9PROT|nr:hypothetical protein [Hyphomonas sp.]HAE28597.1 hypothetical protein [Hyphomonas adhaerens]
MTGRKMLNDSKWYRSLNIQRCRLIRHGMKRIAALFLALGLVVAPAASAQDWMNQFSPGQARDSRNQGRTVPLSQIFNSLKRQYGGYQLGADLYDRGNGKAVYEIDWMTKNGRKMHFVVDAQTGAILDRRGG